MAHSIKKHPEIPDILIINSDKFYDDRGYFIELSKTSEFKEKGLPVSFPQTNLSYSKKNVIRGLHYQLGEKAQGKLVHLIAGKVRDVFVDVRPSSPTFKKSSWVELSGDDNTSLYIPPGFAHGFSVLSEDAYFIYHCTSEYSKDAEFGIKFDDPTLKIDWGVQDPIVSEKDRKLPFLE